MVNDTYDWFKRLVRERRGLNEGELAAASTGQVFSGRQGVPMKLVDAIGGERDAVAWLEREKGVGKDLPIRDWKPRSDRDFSIFAMGGDRGRSLRFRACGRRHYAGHRPCADAAQLDGLLAVWQPSEK